MKKFSNAQKSSIISDLVKKDPQMIRKIMLLVDTMTDDAKESEKETETLALINLYCKQPRQLTADYNRYYAGPLSGLALTQEPTQGSVDFEDDGVELPEEQS